MKKAIILIMLLCLSIGVAAQNVTMAKAFYKKAQIEYENKNYKEVINLLEKTVENLNGETNPDIIYLEAKSRYENDLNINKTKALFNQFLKGADQNDDRINEVSGILVDIETSDNYYDNGNKKTKSYFESDNKKVTEYYLEKGFNYKTEKFINDELVYRLYTGNNNGVYYAAALLDLEDEKHYSYKFFKGSVRNVFYFDKKPVKFKTVKENIQVDEITISVNLEFPIDPPSYVFLIDNGEVRQYYSFNDDGVVFYMFEEFKNLDENKYLVFCYSSKKSETASEIISLHSNGFVKEIYKESYGSSNWIKDERNFFDEYGWPIRQEKSKNGKLKEVKVFDKTTKKWEELKKRDW